MSCYTAEFEFLKKKTGGQIYNIMDIFCTYSYSIFPSSEADIVFFLPAFDLFYRNTPWYDGILVPGYPSMRES